MWISPKREAAINWEGLKGLVVLLFLDFMFKERVLLAQSRMNEHSQGLGVSLDCNVGISLEITGPCSSVSPITRGHGER